MNLDSDYMFFYDQTWQLIISCLLKEFVQWPKHGWKVQLQQLKTTALDLQHHGWKVRLKWLKVTALDLPNHGWKVRLKRLEATARLKTLQPKGVVVWLNFSNRFAAAVVFNRINRTSTEPGSVWGGVGWVALLGATKGGPPVGTGSHVCGA